MFDVQISYKETPRYDSSTSKAIQAWVTENCASYRFMQRMVITNGEGVSMTTYSFGNEVDAMLFKLRWT